MSSSRGPASSQYNVVLKERVMFHVINDEHARGMHFHAPKPKAISFEPPAIRIPAFPGATQTSLKVMQPGIFFVEYDCDKHCRSLGICVHYQFVIGSKKCPDGLVCQRCKQGVDQLVSRDLLHLCPRLNVCSPSKQAASAPCTFALPS